MFTRETAHLDLAYTLDLCSSFWTHERFFPAWFFSWLERVPATHLRRSFFPRSRNFSPGFLEAWALSPLCYSVCPRISPKFHLLDLDF